MVLRGAFLYSSGQMTALATLGRYSSGYAINNAGQVVGWADTGAGMTQAFLYTNGQATYLGTDNGVAYDINNAGQVVGASFNASGFGHAFLYSNGQMTDLGALPGHIGSVSNAISSVGQITGESHLTQGGPTHAILYTNGQMMDLGTLGGTNSHGCGHQQQWTGGRLLRFFRHLHYRVPFSTAMARCMI